ncbi:MAG: Na+/H+ antiporter NhaA [Bacteroidetes bacterium]|nr:Na+/H+ antiporter NhaA [Bacteroidota bacterium]
MVRKIREVSEFKITALFKGFFTGSQTGGILLLLCTLISLFTANSIGGIDYRNFWDTSMPVHAGPVQLEHSLSAWINEGLMALFFLLVGLEIKREFLVGELSNKKTAILPVIAAIGGMIVPAVIYFICNVNSPETIIGAGIPTATDIAFAIAILGLLGNKIPNALKVFLTALAIMDDLGAIILIAVFYGTEFSGFYLILTLALFALLMLFNKLKMKSLWYYLPLGILLWYFMLHSGIHATMAGVLLAIAIPFEGGGHNSAAHILEKFLQKPVNIFIIPIFALANTAIEIRSEMIPDLLGPESLGIILGLFFGKPIGIYLFSKGSQRLKWSQIPTNITNRKLLGAGILGGIGFTMSIFVTNLAFDEKNMIDLGKIAILIASALAAFLGYLLLAYPSRKIDTLN